MATGQHLKPWAECLRWMFPRFVRDNDFIQWRLRTIVLPWKVHANERCSGPRKASQQTVIACCVSVITVCTFATGFLVKYNTDNLGQWPSIILLITFLLMGVLAFVVITAHEQCDEPQKYKVGPSLPEANTPSIADHLEAMKYYN